MEIHTNFVFEGLFGYHVPDDDPFYGLFEDIDVPQGPRAPQVPFFPAVFPGPEFPGLAHHMTRLPVQPPGLIVPQLQSAQPQQNYLQNPDVAQPVRADGPTRDPRRAVENIGVLAAEVNNLARGPLARHEDVAEKGWQRRNERQDRRAAFDETQRETENHFSALEARLNFGNQEIARESRTRQEADDRGHVRARRQEQAHVLRNRARIAHVPGEQARPQAGAVLAQGTGNRAYAAGMRAHTEGALRQAEARAREATVQGGQPPLLPVLPAVPAQPVARGSGRVPPAAARRNGLASMPEHLVVRNVERGIAGSDMAPFHVNAPQR
jgi:hypothetical protein